MKTRFYIGDKKVTKKAAAEDGRKRKTWKRKIKIAKQNFREDPYIPVRVSALEENALQFALNKEVSMTTRYHFPSEDEAWTFALKIAESKTADVTDYGIDEDRLVNPYYIEVTDR